MANSVQSRNADKGSFRRQGKLHKRRSDTLFYHHQFLAQIHRQRYLFRRQAISLEFSLDLGEDILYGVLVNLCYGNTFHSPDIYIAFSISPPILLSILLPLFERFLHSIFT